MSDHPRTDAEAKQAAEFYFNAEVVPSGLARTLEADLAAAQSIIAGCLKALPVGYVPTHTAENLPEMIAGWVKEAAEECQRADALEAENAGLRKEMERHLPILEKAEDQPYIWAHLTEGTGVATLNGYRKALGAGREGEV